MLSEKPFSGAGAADNVPFLRNLKLQNAPLKLGCLSLILAFEM
jgi:hypothetical protein